MIPDQVSTYIERLNSISDTDIAWFGGWLSADGCIMRNPGARTRNGQPRRQLTVPRIRFTITDRDPLDRFAALFGNTVSGPAAPYGNTIGKQPYYSWQITGHAAALILQRVRPWLSERYRGRADLAVSGFSPREHLGRILSPDDVVIIKSELATGARGIGSQLARRFGVTEGMICNIKYGRAWVK
jgi:hypothetical protein